MKHRAYKDPGMQRIYDAMVEAFLKHTDGERDELFMEDGSQRTGGMHRIMFWRGYNDADHPRPVDPHARFCGCTTCTRRRRKPYIVGSQGHACYMAGKDCRTEHDRRDIRAELESIT